MNEIFKSGIIVEQSDIEMKANFNNGSLLSCNWMIEAYINFSNILSQNNFPCLFGRSAYKRKSLKFLFVNEIIDLQKGLLLYTDFIKKTPLEERLYSPLIITFRRIGFKNLTEEHEFCWEQLKLLHSLDEAEWPNDIPKDPHDNQWTFCFDQTQLFFNMSCPSHHHIKSRNLGPYVTFVVNPRQNFDFVASINTSKGVKIRQTIRERVKLYNDGFLPSELGFFGDDDNFEWKQYQLTEPNSISTKVCPFSAKKSKSL